MTSNESRLIQLAQQIGTIGLQTAKAYNYVQANLQLELVLTPVRLSTEAGTLESIETLDQLSTLTSAHKEMFEKFIAAAMTQLTAVLVEIPEERAVELSRGMITSLNSDLSAQAKFYIQRAEWIAAATSICKLVQSCRDSIIFNNDGLAFDNDEELAEFNELTAKIEEIHQLEVTLAADRLTRINNSMGMLGVLK